MKTDTQKRDLLIRVAKIHLHESRARRQSEHAHQRDFAHQLFNWACNATQRAINASKKTEPTQITLQF